MTTILAVQSPFLPPLDSHPLLHPRLPPPPPPPPPPPLVHCQPSLLPPPLPKLYENQNRKQLIRWVPPPLGWLKVNTDASVRSDGKTGYGIIVRDDHGFWRMGCCGHFIGDTFDKSIGPKCENVVKGEVKAIFEALNIVKELQLEKQYKGIVIESDSKTAIDLIKLHNDQNNNRKSKYSWLTTDINNMVSECRKLLNSLGCIIIQHQKREGNICADKLASMGAQGNERVRIFEHPPHQIIPYLIVDNRGFPFPRGTKLNDQDIINICEQLS